MKSIFCIGGALIDETFYCTEEPKTGTSNPAAFYRTPGGVSRNIAHHLSQLGNRVELITHFGNDPDGQWLTGKCREAGIGLRHALINQQSTGRYAAILDNEGALFAGAAAMHFETEISKDFLISKSEVLLNASLIQIDCNLSNEALQWIIAFCNEKNIQCIVDPVSVSKAGKLNNMSLENILLITPNEDELIAIESDVSDKIHSLLLRGIKNVWLRKGAKGSQMFFQGGSVSQPSTEIEITDVTGAGDAMLAGWIHFYLRNNTMEECIIAGHAMAELTLQQKGGVVSHLSHDMLLQKIKSIGNPGKFQSQSFK